jgi:hypothetical protein
MIHLDFKIQLMEIIGKTIDNLLVF